MSKPKYKIGDILEYNDAGLSYHRLIVGITTGMYITKVFEKCNLKFINAFTFDYLEENYRLHSNIGKLGKLFFC